MSGQYADRAGFVVRVLSTNSHQPVGMGFLVDELHLITCAHVVNAALGRPERDQDEPPDDVRIPVDFPILGGADGAPVRLCRVARWLPPPRSGVAGDDLAGLAVVGEPAPAEAGPARLPEDAGLPLGAEVHVFGHPATLSRHSGAWATARVRGRVGGGLLQIDSDTASAIRLQAGYSGSPLVLPSADGDAVIGMLAVASGREDRRDAYGIPVDRLTRAWPEVMAGIPPCPYPGLRPFGTTDENLFVGREDDVEQLSAMVGDDVLALVVGPSGIGKSSLVNAGLMPRWRRAVGGAGVTIRPGPRTSRPLDRILGDLEAALRAATELDAWSLDVDDAPGGLAAAVSHRAEALGTSVLIHFDQFEELLSGTTADDHRDVVDVLLPTSRDTYPSCRVVVTMRADFLPALLELPGQGGRLRHRMLALSPMGVPALERAISEPASVRGVVYEPGLARQIAVEASGGPGALPLMAFTLTQLWESQRGRRLTFADYLESGGVAGAVNQYAERLFERFAGDGQAHDVKSVMLALVRSRGGAKEASSRAVPLTRLHRTASLVDELCRARLLVVETSNGDGEPLVRLAHESLVRAWSRFARWVDEDADFQRWLAAMEERVTDDELLADSRLGPAEQWLAERRADIPAEVVALVERSRSASHRRIAELESARAEAVEAAARAERAAAEAEARRLAAASELALTTATRGGPVPLVLATTSVRTMWTLEGDAAVRKVLKCTPLPISRFPERRNPFHLPRLLSSGRYLVLPVPESDSLRVEHLRTRLVELGPAGRTWRQVYEENGDVRFTEDGRLALVEERQRVTVVEVETGATLIELRDRHAVALSCLSRNGSRLAVVRGRRRKCDNGEKLLHDATVTVVDVATGAIEHVRHADVLCGSLIVSDDCTLLAATRWWYDSDLRQKAMTETVVHDLVREREPVVVEHDGSASDRLVFSPNGRFLAAGANYVDSCGDAHTGWLEIFDLEANGRRTFHLYQYLPVQELAFDPKGRWLAVALGDERKRQTPGAGLILDAETGNEHRRLHHDYAVTSARFNADGSRVLFAGKYVARAFDSASGAQLLRADHEHTLADAVFAPDSSRLVTVTSEHGEPARLYESRSVETVRVDIPGYFDRFNLSRDGRTAFLSFWTSGAPYQKAPGTTWVVDTLTGERRGEYHHGPRGHVIHSTDDGSLIAVNDEGLISVYRTGDETPITTIRQGLGLSPVRVRVTPDGQQLVTASNNAHHESPGGEIRFTSLADGARVRAVGLTGAVHDLTDNGHAALVVTREPKRTASGGTRKPWTLAVIDTVDGAQRFQFPASGSSAAALAPGGEWVAAECDRTLTVRRACDGQVVWSTTVDLAAERNSSTWVVASPTGRHLAVGDYAATRPSALALFDARDGRQLARFDTINHSHHPAFSLDGRRAAVIADSAARVIDIETAETLCVVEHEVYPIDQVAFAGSHGTHLITIDRGSLRLASVDTGRLLTEADARVERELTESERQRHLPQRPG